MEEQNFTDASQAEPRPNAMAANREASGTVTPPNTVIRDDIVSEFEDVEQPKKTRFLVNEPDQNQPMELPEKSTFTTSKVINGKEYIMTATPAEQLFGSPSFEPQSAGPRRRQPAPLMIPESGYGPSESKSHAEETQFKDRKPPKTKDQETRVDRFVNWIFANPIPSLLVLILLAMIWIREISHRYDSEIQHDRIRDLQTGIDRRKRLEDDHFECIKSVEPGQCGGYLKTLDGHTMFCMMGSMLTFIDPEIVVDELAALDTQGWKELAFPPVKCEHEKHNRVRFKRIKIHSTRLRSVQSDSDVMTTDLVGPKAACMQRLIEVFKRGWRCVDFDSVDGMLYRNAVQASPLSELIRERQMA